MSNPLSPRQMEILAAMSQGLMEKEMARDMGISPNTIKRHKGTLFQRIGAANSAHAVYIAMKAGWIS